MSSKEQSPSTHDNKNSEERTSLEILGGERMWDKAGTGFSMPYQKPSQTKRLNHADALRESNELLGIKPTNFESSSTDDNSIEITFFRNK